MEEDILPGTAATTRAKSSAEPDYQEIRVYEHHFNSLEMETRKLASIWLLASLSAIAYLVREDTSKAMVNAKVLIEVVCLMGNFGLFVLWILDQLVYHRLLNAVFLLALRMEYQDIHLPPIRTLMMLFSQKRGVARYMTMYYYIPMFGLASVALIVGIWYIIDTYQVIDNHTSQIIMVVLIGASAAAIPLWIVWRRRYLETYKDIAKDFGDDGFTELVGECNYGKILERYEYDSTR